MKKVLLGITGVVVIAVASGVIFKEPLFTALERMITSDMFVDADQDTYDPGLAVGTAFPEISARYDGGVIVGIDAFMDSKGLIFVAVRSADWCPFCRKQLIQLQEYVGQFRKAGIGVVAITYDSPEILEGFATEFGITYPLISDIDAKSIKTLGILNAEYEPGDSNYGIPYPGIFVLNKQQRVAGKVFLEGYATRVSAPAVLEYAKGVLAR